MTIFESCFYLKAEYFSLIHILVKITVGLLHSIIFALLSVAPDILKRREIAEVYIYCCYHIQLLLHIPPLSP